MHTNQTFLRSLILVFVGMFLATVAHAQSSPQTVRLGMLPIVSQAPVFLGEERGFFKEEGLKVEIRMFQGGPEVTAAVIGGDIDFGYANPVSPILAFVQGAPLRIAAPSDLANESVVNGILVSANSPIKTLKDLEGRRVAVNTLKGVLELLVREGVGRAGGSPAKVVFVEAPFPQMGTLLTAGQVDAVVNVEPFITAMVQSGSRIVANAVTPIEGAPMGVWFATTKRLENRDMLERFRRAIGKANLYASKNPSEVRKIIQTYTRINAEVAAKIALPTWGADLPLSTIQQQIDMMGSHNFLRRQFNASDIVAK